jgi:hypothetical protein
MITLDGTNGITTPDVEVDSIGTSTSTAVTVRTNGVERLRVDSAGNVGIGTSSPSARLHVFDSTAASSTESAGLILGRGGDDSGKKSSAILFDIGGGGAGAARIYTERLGGFGGNLIFATGDASGNTPERVRIDSNGNLAIGSTSVGYDGTNTGIWCRGGLKVLQAARDSNPCADFARIGTDGNVVTFLKGATVVGSISVTGSATAYNTSSDYRLKEDVQPMVGSVDRLMALKPVNFAWKADGSRVDGFLAHEAQEVVPECVTGEKDAVDDEGTPQYQGIDQSKIVPLLVAALQEALTKIEALEARVAALETNA